MTALGHRTGGTFKPILWWSAAGLLLLLAQPAGAQNTCTKTGNGCSPGCFFYEEMGVCLPAPGASQTAPAPVAPPPPQTAPDPPVAPKIESPPPAAAAPKPSGPVTCTKTGSGCSPGCFFYEEMGVCLPHPN